MFYQIWGQYDSKTPASLSFHSNYLTTVVIYCTSDESCWSLGYCPKLHNSLGSKDTKNALLLALRPSHITRKPVLQKYTTHRVQITRCNLTRGFMHDVDFDAFSCHLPCLQPRAALRNHFEVALLPRSSTHSEVDDRGRSPRHHSLPPR